MTWIHHSNFYFVQDYIISIPCLLNAICYHLLLCILTTNPVKYFYSYRFLVGMGDKAGVHVATLIDIVHCSNFEVEAKAMAILRQRQVNFCFLFYFLWRKVSFVAG